jgi:hypothetical protein
VSSAALALIFAGAQVLDSRITFARSGLATQYDSTGKLTYAPNNIMTNSNSFTGGEPGGGWAAAVGNETRVAAAATTPWGNPAARITTLQASGIYKATGVIVGVTYLYAITVKAATPNAWRFSFGPDANPSTGSAIFNVGGGAAGTAGTVQSAGANTIASGVIDLGGGWYRCWLKGIPTATSQNVVAYTSGNSGAFYIAEGQIEAVTYQTTPRTYIPTTSAVYHGPRFDYDPSVVGANLALQTEDFTSASNWVKSNAGTGSAPTVTANQAVAPNGTLTADKWTFALNGGVTSNDQSSFQQQVSATNGVTYTSSIWARADTPCWLAFRNPSNSGTYQSIYVGTEWQRFSISGAPSAGTAVLGVGLRNATGTTFVSDSATVYLWGAQIELGTYAKVYSPTTSAAAFGASGVSPSIATPRGLLVEEARTNIFLQSGALGTAPNTLGSTTISQSGTSPDGSANAWLLAETTANAVHQVYQSITYTAAAWTVSIYAKAAVRAWLWINIAESTPADNRTWFNLATGAVGTNAAGNTAAIVDVGGGWYRCSITRTTVAGAGYSAFGMAGADNSSSYVGVATNTLSLYGPQAELGAFATSYIPTTTASVTRAIDLPTSAFAHDAAVPITIYAKATPRGVVGVTAVVASLDDGTSNNRHTVYNSAASARAQITITGGVTQANLSGGTPVIGTSQKSAMSAKLDDVGFAQAGTAATRDTSSNTMPPGLTTLRIGHAAAGTTPFNGHIEEIRIFRHDNTNTQLVALTA